MINRLSTHLQGETSASRWRRSLYATRNEDVPQIWGITAPKEKWWISKSHSKNRVRDGLMAGLVCFKPAKGIKLPKEDQLKVVPGRPGWLYFTAMPSNPFNIVRTLLTKGTLYRTIWNCSIRKLMRSPPTSLTGLWFHPKPPFEEDEDSDDEFFDSGDYTKGVAKRLLMKNGGVSWRQLFSFGPREQSRIEHWAREAHNEFSEPC